MVNFARTDRIAQQIQREIAELVRLQIKDPRVRLVTITGVEVAGDYAHAKIFFTRMDGKHAEAQQGLDHASGFLRSLLAHSIKLRVMPQLHFVYDSSVERGSHLSQLIDQAVASDKENSNHSTAPDTPMSAEE